MTPEPKPLKTSQSLSTTELLIRAAAEEFNSCGFHGTNTNKIAKAANFATQTFYRHFEDKIEIFLAVYEYWQAEERQVIAKALKNTSREKEVAQAILNHHVKWRGFRRSLRLLATEEERVRKARTQSRERQLSLLQTEPDTDSDERANLISALLTIERLCDAAADEEFVDLGLSNDQVKSLVTSAIRQLPGLK